MGLSKELSCEAGSFSHGRNPHRCFQLEVLRLYFPALDPWVETSVSLRSCFSQFIHMQMWDYLLHQPPLRPLGSSSCCLATCPLCPSCPSALLLVWMNVSSLTPWLLDFYTIRFSGTSGCCLILNLSLSLFWLCKEAQCIYLHLHLGQKSLIFFSKDDAS